MNSDTDLKLIKLNRGVVEELFNKARTLKTPLSECLYKTANICITPITNINNKNPLLYLPKHLYQKRLSLIIIKKLSFKSN